MSCLAVLKDLNASMDTRLTFESGISAQHKLQTPLWNKDSSDEANKLRSRLISSIQRFETVRHRLDSTYQAGIDQDDQIDYYRTTALIEGAVCGFGEIVDMLLDAGAHINGTAHGRTALLAASKAGNASLVRSLCMLGADANFQTGVETPLMAASQAHGARAPDVMAELIKYGADVNVVVEGRTALIIASADAALEVVSLLIKAGADPNIIMDDTVDGTALIAASWRGYLRVVQVLLDKGANVNAEACGSTALSVACKYGRFDIVKNLPNRGADTNLPLIGGNKALQEAASRDNVDTVRLLLIAGADIGQGAFPLSPLNTAALNGYWTIAHLLIEAGADVNSIGAVDTVLESASMLGRDEIVRKLLAAGATPKSFNRGGIVRSPLHSAARFGKHTVVKMLVEAGARIDDTSSSGTAALHVACASGREKVVETLIQAGANLDIQCPDGTALEIAEKQGYTNIVDKLAKAHANRPRAFLIAHFPHSTRVRPGDVVTQSWTLQNPGPRSWPAGSALYYSGGAGLLLLDDGAHNQPSALEPGRSTVLTMRVQAPDSKGRYVAFWGLRCPDGIAFGDSLPLHLIVE
ncbi:hypothetical protein PV04_04841 [Phialophora macrospora]|uniref:Nbr1 FW domain-containing protein n=1 Tax=Phialophora macrospora TaxID=1851006 RepID=A0A0D2GAC6_9EURO|nr:hypothetical protein PV04_04841 [Phialophora macrospora]